MFMIILLYPLCNSFLIWYPFLEIENVVFIERKSSEWSPDIINDVTRIPDPIAIETGPGQYVTEDSLDGKAFK